MTFSDYQRSALRTSRSEPHRERMLVQALGLNGEAGEVAELIKKWAWHGKELAPDVMAKELGDCLWYLADLASACNLSLDTIAELNVSKLQQRYPDGFTADGGKR